VSSPSNKTKYVDKQLIEMDFGLKDRDARKVQKLLRRERQEKVTAD
jgi:hypothetical protein